jgi:hypothetical protein
MKSAASRTIEEHRPARTQGYAMQAGWVNAESQLI